MRKYRSDTRVVRPLTDASRRTLIVETVIDGDSANEDTLKAEHGPSSFIEQDLPFPLCVLPDDYFESGATNRVKRAERDSDARVVFAIYADDGRRIVSVERE